MEKEFSKLNLHQKLEILVREMVEDELPLEDALKEFQKVFIVTAAKKYKGNQTKIAKAIGLHRNTLHNRVKLLKLKKII